jgi:hypothetical protein
MEIICSFICAQRFLQSMRAIQGALIVSSSIQIILGYSQLWGIFSRYFTLLCSRSNLLHMHSVQI